MALILIPKTTPEFSADSSDIIDNKIPGLGTIGAKVYLTDTKITKIVNDDLTLSDYIVNSDLQVADIQIGAVEIKDATTGSRAVIDSNGKLSVKEADGDNVTIGAKADSAITDPTTSMSLISGLKGIMTYIKNVITSNRVQVDVSSLPTGSNLIGKVGIDQTTHGTTDKVAADVYFGGSVSSATNQVATNVTEQEISIEITRPADTTAYTANDIINADSATTLPALDFSTLIGVSMAGRRIQINSLQLTSSYGGATTKLVPEVILYKANTLTGQTLTDNTAFNPTYAQHVANKASAFSKQENWILSDFAYGNFYEMRLTEIVRNATLDANGKLYPAIIATNAYTPANGEKITLTLKFYLLN